ncbi:MAG: tRNA uridine(34) 5-carboxymethylaminomethyl modification radical SAM/GNAT enzyme Elp3 [Anaerolineae bacterium]|nr:tRNA uridine(34) 5-carboxymethylaminomethyl modification radical SAM/GNAT enzyme Elp3 [Anaerolineae bacterium]
MPRYRFEQRARGTSPELQAEWRARNHAPLAADDEVTHILAYIDALRATTEADPEFFSRLVRRLSKQGHPIYSKARLRQGYLDLVEAGHIKQNDAVLAALRMKPVRTLSGVAPVTVLTKPYACPGQCIFCPDDIRMPKSYLSNEPGAMRALILRFDPYEQVTQRLAAMKRIGHPTDKIELLILGGTWSSYPQDYREWFVRRLFDALNGTESESVGEALRRNESAPHRNTGLVIETRPDAITPEEVRHLRGLGVTRVQLGVQSLDNHLLAINKRGHTAEDVRRAVRLLRSAGFKIALHWMPNLLGATPESDLADFRRFWDDPALCPDEMKLYPTGLIRNTELYDHYLRGEYHPYSEDELIDLLLEAKKLVPRYCRLNRVMRDIPAPEIAAGVTASNLRQILGELLRGTGTPCRCIRCREVRGTAVEPASLNLQATRYATDHSTEVFWEMTTPGDELAGFLRLSLPTSDDAPIAAIAGHALIRQVQVYGPALALEEDAPGRAQHQGLGRRLIEAAEREAGAAGFRRISVIAAAGTREYYRRLGYENGELYMSKDIHTNE